MKSGNIHPKIVKTEMALAIMDQLHPKEENRSAIDEWNRIHDPKNRSIPDDIQTVQVGSEFFADKNPQLAFLLNKFEFTTSVSEGRRLIKNGGIYVNDEKISDEAFSLEKGNEYTIRQGKKGKFIKLVT
jgi:tyrosyl-tRNA synthetase